MRKLRPNDHRSSPDIPHWSIPTPYCLRLQIFRGIGTFLFCLAFYLILRPFAVVFSFIPLLGRLISGTFFLAALLVGVSCALFTIASAWCFVKPLRACFLFILLGGLYFLEVTYDGADITPVYILGGLAGIAATLALWECFLDCKYTSLAQKGLNAKNYVQVGQAVPKGKEGGAMSATAKNMV